MIKKTTLTLLLLSLATACVSKKTYKDLESKYADLKKENRKLVDFTDLLQQQKNQSENTLAKTQDELTKLKAEHKKLQSDLATSEKNLKNLQEAYKSLEKNSDESIKANMAKNRDLLAQLDAKEKALADEQEKFNKTKSDLAENTTRLQELEALINAKEASMKKLKESLSKALNGFEGKGLTVEQKNGKVYVSMENKLLFGTGSWAVGPEGKKAVVEVGKILAQNPEIAVLIEGHTDNDKFGSPVGQIENNWDLSTKRATAIVQILTENKSIKAENLTAAGRGEFAPLMSNDTPDGKAKNRRIEIILTPKLDEISKMLNELN
ncbi:cell envelope biogenesis protein OmpA [Flavobacterium branchiophilum NBRC 15030 = ATCC 35035]|uniref:Chemotaxis protein MotB n=1 Tax=Flavobacterium branchiophilum TaxID=55197 RepID=A0A543G1Z1_9FLAO|nr:OmpA family protein [Flavobacterium branchiophilum]OXA73800.1 cell envelope biogenesis protein OmpA [Flavobacterium branchiophilum NBRC 15030 = ATCC 35035]TQM40091.1 chemotaxis protein MotB [Flavobacterium branchiophilum]GEM55914.1 cell envelope biogenesis protein OmpA [Flavobacterium branchiophilum NBRC 15030 = ATCC 35035]